MSGEYAVWGETPDGRTIMIHRGFETRDEAEDYPIIMAAWRRVWVAKVNREPRRQMSNIYTSSWNEARVEQMTSLWSSGYSAGMIARELGGFESTPDGGRNSVIGKLHRMGLVGTEKPRYTLRRGNGYRRRSGPSVIQARRVAVVPIKALRPARVVIAEPLEAPQSLRKTLLELQSGECKWPSGDGPWTFCANPVQPGSAYCSWHRSIAYTKGTQKDVDRIASRCLGGKLHASKTFVLEA